MIRFACASGLRPEEYLALRRDDVDFDQHIIHVRRVVVDGAEREGEGKTDASVPRDVVLTTRAADALRAVTPLRGDGLWFPNKSGRFPRPRQLPGSPLDEGSRSGGARAPSPYQCRHTFATMALAATTGDLAWVAEQLGHTDLQTTRKHYARYVKPLHDAKRQMLDQAWSEDSSGVKAVSEADGEKP